MASSLCAAGGGSPPPAAPPAPSPPGRAAAPSPPPPPPPPASPRQADPDGLVTYASFPPTEYLDLSSLDFVTFNVYLHDPEAFRRYLLRLHNLVGDRPLVLGEFGMDTFRHGEDGQARFLA